MTSPSASSSSGASSSTPLINSSESTVATVEDDKGFIEKHLNGHSFAINPVRLAPGGPLTLTSVLSKATKISVAVIFSPLLFLGTLGFTAGMKWSPWCQNKFFSLFLTRILSVLAKKFSKERRTLLSHVSGKVLDVGCGSGAYIRYYQNASHVVALEPATVLHAKIREEERQWLKEHKVSVSIYTLGLEAYLEEYPNEVEKFDWVILGNVLCEVSDVKSTLVQVDRSLKQTGGWVYFSEHVACSHGSWKRSFQNWFNPWWNIISGGCNINHDSLIHIQSMPNWEVISWTFPIQVGLGPFVLGLAHKMRTQQR